MKWMILIAITFCSYVALAQNLRVYHGGKNNSTIFEKGDDERNSGWGDSSSYVVKANKNFDIVVINPNHFFYSYDIKTEEFEIKDDSPDLTDLLAALSSLVPQSSALGRELSRSASGPTEYEAYLSILKTIQGDLNQAKTYIEASDVPESKKDALEANSVSGFRQAVSLINNLESFKKIKTIEKDLGDAFKDALTNGTGGMASTLGIGGDAVKIDLYTQAFKLLNQSLISSLKQIKEVADMPSQIYFNVGVKQKPMKVRLIIKRKNENEAIQREEMDRLICVLLPEFSRPVLELIPVGNLTYSSNIPLFTIKNGVIVQDKDDGFRFRAGPMLIYNFARFGPTREGAVGIGLGYNIPQKGVLETFYLGSLVSYKSVFRVGFGFGFSEYPNGLKQGAEVNKPMPTDVKDLNDLIDYKRKLTGFLSFSFSGIPLIKK